MTGALVGSRRKLWSWGRAMLGSTMDTCFSSSRVAFGRISTIFYLKGLSRLLSSILVLRHIVDHGSGMFHAGFTGIDAPRAVFPRLPAVDASVAHEQHLEICTLFSTSPLYFSACSAFEILRESIFWSPRALTGVSV